MIPYHHEVFYELLWLIIKIYVDVRISIIGTIRWGGEELHFVAWFEIDFYRCCKNENKVFKKVSSFYIKK